jgi:hypothetical protein
MKFNKILLLFLVVGICLLSLTLTASAQRKKTTTKKPANTTNKTSTNNANNANILEIKSGAEKVSIQIKNVTKFIYVLGGVARGIEDADKEARDGKLSKTAIDKNNEFKQNVISSIRNLRAGLAALEVEFRTKPALKTYLLQIQGVTDLCGQAEDMAMSGKFTDSGKMLLLVIEKLSDTLAAMP